MSNKKQNKKLKPSSTQLKIEREKKQPYKIENETETEDVHCSDSF